MIVVKRNIIYQPLEECDIKTADDIHEALKDLLGGTIKEISQERKSTFEPQVVKKRQEDISDIGQKIISLRF